MKIVVFKYGECLYPENRIFKTSKNEGGIPMSFCFYLIQTKDKNILVDVGCDGMARYNFYASKLPHELLEEYGLKPSDITDIIVTHAHFDHIDDIKRYKDVTIHIQKDEYERGKEKLGDNATFNIFDEEYCVEDNICIKRYGGHTSGSCIIFADDYVLCGDECYFQRNLDEIIPTGNSFSKEKSLEFVKTFHDGKYKPLLFHDAEILKGKAGFSCIYESDN